MGTWALPKTKAQAESFRSLMMQPLKAKDVEDKLYYLLGDDELFDEIEEFRSVFGDDGDVRALVIKHLAQFLEHIEECVPPWDSDAYAICLEIHSQFT